MTEEKKIAPVLEAQTAIASHADYFDSVFAVPPVVCGRELKPLSITRYRLMAWKKVAFVDEIERTATWGDLLMGVLICSMSVKDFLAFAAQPDFKAQIMKWGRREGFFEPRFWDWGMKSKADWMLNRVWPEYYAQLNQREMMEQIQKFQDYIKLGSVHPPYMEKTDSSGLSAAHWSQSIEVILRGELGWSSDEIDETPLNKALADYFKYCENQGLVELLTPEQDADNKRQLTAEELEESRIAAKKVQDFLNGRTEAANG